MPEDRIYLLDTFTFVFGVGTLTNKSMVETPQDLFDTLYLQKCNFLLQNKTEQDTNEILVSQSNAGLTKHVRSTHIWFNKLKQNVASGWHVYVQDAIAIAKFATHLPSGNQCVTQTYRSLKYNFP